MFNLLSLSDSFRHPAEFPARAFELALRMLLLRTIHLRQGFGEPPARAPQDGMRHIQIALHLFHRRRFCERRLPLRFQKQFRFGKNALAHYARAFAPCGIELPGLPRIAAVPHENSGHLLTVIRADPRHGNQILHRHLRAEVSFAHLPLDCLRQ